MDRAVIKRAVFALVLLAGSTAQAQVLRPLFRGRSGFNTTLTPTVTGTWTPASLGTANVGWWDATDTSTITLNGSTVSGWKDKSTYANNFTQATAAQQPNYNSTAPQSIGFTATTNIMGSAQTWASPMAILWVGQSAQSSGFGAIVGGGNGDGGFEIQNNANSVGFLKQSIQQLVGYSTGLSQSAKSILIAVYDGTNATIRVNGTQVATAAVTTTITARTITVGNASNGEQFLGTTSQLALSTDTSLATLQKLEGYAACKNNIQSVLPAGHPYKSSCPAP